MIRQADPKDFEEILNIINDSAIAYKGIIPADCWREPYMSREELKMQIEDGVIFSCYMQKNEMIGVMGIQDKTDVNLIRHAYVRTQKRQQGIGSSLLLQFIKASGKPILIGTWKAAYWAINFYERHGFYLVEEEEKDRLARKFWTIPDRQVETSVVLADRRYQDIFGL